MMSVYGRDRTKRKRTKLTSDSSIFSSEEEDNTDRSSLDQSIDRFTTIVQDKEPSVGKKWELLPSADIKKKSSVQIKKEKRSAVEDSMQFDPLTTSPKKFTRLISNMRSPLKKNDFVTEGIKTPKKSVSEQLKDLVSPGSSPTRLVQSPSTTPSEKDAWNSLFEEIDEVGVKVPRITKNKGPETVEDGEGENNDIRVGLESLIQDLNKGAEPQTHPIQPRKEIFMNRASRKRTYGNERTYLVDDAEENGQQSFYKDIQKEQISDFHDYDRDHNDEENEDKHNVYDLRISGKLSQKVELMSYIMEGLVFRESDNLLRDNSLLVTTLLDLIHKLTFDRENLMTDMYHTVVEKISKILEKLGPSKSSEKSFLIKLIAIVIYEFVIAAERDEYIVRQIFKAITEFETVLHGLAIGIDEDMSTMTKKYSSDIKRYNGLGEQMQMKLIELLQEARIFGQVRCFVSICKLLTPNKTDELKKAIISFLEVYFEEGDAIPTLEYLRPEIEATMKNISELHYNDIDAGILKLLVILSTNYSHNDDYSISSIYQNDYVKCLLTQVNSTYDLIMQQNGSEIDMNISLFALGFLINFIEFERFSVDQSELERNKLLLQKIAKLESVAIKHLVGYNMILLAYLHFENSSVLQVSFLLNGLKKFKRQVKNQGIENKIIEIINTLEN